MAAPRHSAAHLTCCLPNVCHVAKGAPEFFPACALDQIRVTIISMMVLQVWVFKEIVHLGWPSHISLYSISCFQLVLPRSWRTPLAAVGLNCLQQGQRQYSLDELLEPFGEAGAVFEVLKIASIIHELIWGAFVRVGQNTVTWVRPGRPRSTLSAGV